MKKTKVKTLRKFANEETKTAKDYSQRGFHLQAGQERQHAKFFRSKIKVK